MTIPGAFLSLWLFLFHWHYAELSDIHIQNLFYGYFEVYKNKRHGRNVFFKTQFKIQDGFTKERSRDIQSNYMKKRVFLIYGSYLWTRMLIGLTFHPYHSIRETLRRPVLLPVIFSPLIAIILLFLAAKIGSLIIFIYGNQRDIVAIFLSTTLISILFWQVLLLYFLISFFVAMRKK